MKKTRLPLLVLISLFWLIPAVLLAGDTKAEELADRVMARMGGQESWDNARFVTWKFFGKRLHHWDRWTGDIRIQTDDRLVLMNIKTKEGIAVEKGKRLTGKKLTKALDQGWKQWINDSYWMFMPYKLRDPGVVLKYLGKGKLEDGRAAEEVEMTFSPENGVTPDNKYIVRVAEDTGLIEEWSFFKKKQKVKPGFTMPWSNWKPFGEIWLATSHGRDLDWEIAVLAEVPSGMFSDLDWQPE